MPATRTTPIVNAGRGRAAGTSVSASIGSHGFGPHAGEDVAFSERQQLT